MRRPATLRGRIALVATAVTGSWVVVLTVGFNLVLAGQLQQQADSVLRTRAEAVASTVEVSAGGEVSVRAVRDDDASDVGTWIFAGTRQVESPARTDPLDGQAAALADRGELSVSVGTTDPARLYAFPVTAAGVQVATVVSALSLAPYRQNQQLALVGSAVLAMLLLVGVHLVLRVSTDRALRPVQEMTEQAGRWSADDVDRRFGAGERPVELRRLAATLDGVLDRLSAVLRHEQSFTAELSHELRTPLAAIVAETDLLRSRPRTPTEIDEALGQITDSARRMTRILDTLMSTARSNGGAPPGRSDIAVVLGHLAQRWPHPVTLVLDIPAPVVVGVEADVVERLVSPLLDNAARYARTRVTVWAGTEPDAVRLTVHDDGPGIAAADAARVFEPGWRADPADGHDGAGLGLALVHRLATATGGAVTALPDPDGTTVELSLPRG